MLLFQICSTKQTTECFCFMVKVNACTVHSGSSADTLSTVDIYTLFLYLYTQFVAQGSFNGSVSL